MYLNGLMTGTDETTFGVEEKITKAELSEVLNKIYGTYEVTDSTSDVSMLKLMSDLNKLSGEGGIKGLLSNFVKAVELILSDKAFRAVTKAEAALEIYNFVK